MSRVIKFRAWAKRSKTMEIINSLYWFEENGVHDSGGLGSNDNYDIMQFTGLHDVNGVEIYEGDIVKCHYISLMMPSLRGSEYEVKYEPSLGFMPIHDIFDYDGARTEGKDWEVIGNIHENQELLKCE